MKKLTMVVNIVCLMFVIILANYPHLSHAGCDQGYSYHYFQENFDCYAWKYDWNSIVRRMYWRYKNCNGTPFVGVSLYTDLRERLNERKPPSKIYYNYDYIPKWVWIPLYFDEGIFQGLSSTKLATRKTCEGVYYDVYLIERVFVSHYDSFGQCAPLNSAGRPNQFVQYTTYLMNANPRPYWPTECRCRSTQNFSDTCPKFYQPEPFFGDHNGYGFMVLESELCK